MLPSVMSPPLCRGTDASGMVSHPILHSRLNGIPKAHLSLCSDHFVLLSILFNSTFNSLRKVFTDKLFCRQIVIVLQAIVIAPGHHKSRATRHGYASFFLHILELESCSWLCGIWRIVWVSSCRRRERILMRTQMRGTIAVFCLLKIMCSILSHCFDLVHCFAFE